MQSEPAGAPRGGDALLQAPSSECIVTEPVAAPVVEPSRGSRAALLGLRVVLYNTVASLVLLVLLGLLSSDAEVPDSTESAFGWLEWLTTGIDLIGLGLLTQVRAARQSRATILAFGFAAFAAALQLLGQANPSALASMGSWMALVGYCRLVGRDLMDADLVRRCTRLLNLLVVGTGLGCLFWALSAAHVFAPEDDVGAVIMLAFSVALVVGFVLHIRVLRTTVAHLAGGSAVAAVFE